jgi:broad specificity phosphatase PhoE
MNAVGTCLPHICLVRHGETAWTLTGQHTGRSDISLTARGEDEARRLNAPLRDFTFSDVFTSPLQRAQRTCELAGFGPVARADSDLLEWDYGEYEGRRTAEIRAEHPGWRLFDDGCPGGESVADIAARADRLIARLRQCSGNVLLFGHRDMFRVCAARWLDLPGREGRRFYLTPGSLSIVGYDHGLDEPVIRLWNASGSGPQETHP